MSISKITLLISIIGFSGGFIVPIIGTLFVIYWNGYIGSWLEFYLFIFFEILCIIGLILGIKIKTKIKESNYSIYSIIICLSGLIINSFWIIGGLGAMSY